MRLNRLLLIGSTLLILLSSQRALQAQYVVMTSSVTYDSATNKVNGVSQTTMDYYTSWGTTGYRAKTKGYIYTQNPSAPLASSEAQGAVGQSVVTVQTQASASPYVQYNLRSEHFLLPNTVYYGQYYDYSNYYYVSPAWIGISQYGASKTLYGCPQTQPGGCYANFLYDWLWLGNTNTSLRTPPTLTLTNERVSGNLKGTTQNALLGSPADFQASVTPTGLGGNYVWTFTGPWVQEFSSQDNSYKDIYWTEPGTYTANVTYSGKGFSVSGTVTVIIRVPTLTHFAGSSVGNVVDRGRNCSRISNSLPFGATYSLGCSENNAAGMLWSATASIPNVPYLTALGDAGIQFKQIVSVFRKNVNNGRHECWTTRTTPSDTATGWQIDGSEVFASGQYNNPTFLSGKTITAQEFDSPAHRLDRNNADGPPYQREAVLVDDRFETYVMYFTGSPGEPSFVRLLHIPDAGCPADRFDCGVDRLAWNWAGQVHYDSSIPVTLYRETAATTQVGTIAATRTPAIRSYSAVPAQQNVYSLCQGSLDTNNPIDGSRFFVEKLYLDVLNRPADQGGWDAWTSVITSCGFDTVCTNNQRIHVARGFLESPENFANNPALANPGSHEYNREYVRLCYTSFLDRDPDAPGWDGWTDFIDTHPGEYSHLVGGFINSLEYRNRWIP